MPATVDRVQSGQTLELLYPLPINSALTVDKIRLSAITAPDLKQEPWGPEARNCLRDQVQRQVVRIEPASANADSYGRLWANVWWGDRLINETLLEAGCVFLDEAALAHHPHREKLIYAQERARILGLGVWNPAQPLRQSPDDFRRSTAVAPASEP
ncbi:thermonuclease family protein [Leptolyngbya sp. PCC 6406]|uniref:thermonuclease family protein n=1 Tax=Leptolyngbya sp. PCC 6406 TaxID=1173264 RepID=UPI0002F0EECF|nr:thermonuclease family protein [Leptolyngbya sp. PCC 6406]